MEIVGKKTTSRISGSSKVSRGSSRRKTVDSADFYFGFPREKRDYVKQIMATLVKLLDENNCDDIVALEVEDAVHPFHSPALPIVVESQGSSRTKALFKYVRKAKNQEEKIRLHLMNVVAENAIQGFFVAGPLVDYPLFKAVVKLISSIETLKVLRLVNCSLKKEGLIILGKYLPKTGVTHLYLDRNPVPDQNYHCILQCNRVLLHLSLVQCHIDVKGARLLAPLLGPPAETEPPHSLKYLNLSNNRLDCFAMKFLAQGLKWNRDLVYISLAGNRIGNAGLQYLCNALQKSELENWEKELKEKRLIRRTETVKEMVDNLLLNSMYEAESDMIEYEDSGERDIIRREHMLKYYIENDPNPLSRDVILEDGKLVTKGNKTLSILNISYNKIGEDGFEHLLNVLRYQNKERHGMKIEDKINYHLKDIILMGNFCPVRCKPLKKIAYYLRKFKIVEPEPEIEYEEEEEDMAVEEYQMEEEEQQDNVTEPFAHESERHPRRKIHKVGDEPPIDGMSTIDFNSLFTVLTDTAESDEIVTTPSKETSQRSAIVDENLKERSIVNESDSVEEYSLY